MSVYAIVWAYEQDVENSGAKFTLVTAAQYCSDEGICWVKQETLAADMSMGVRTVRDHLNHLEAANLIERVERRRTDGTRTSDLIKLVGFSRRQNSPVEPPSTGEIEQINRQISPGNKRQEETLLTSPSGEDAGGSAAQPSAPDLIADLVEKVGPEPTPPLTRARKARYGKEHKEALAQGHGVDILLEANTRIAWRWPDYQLSVEEAIRDNGRRGNGGPGRRPRNSIAVIGAREEDYDLDAYRFHE